MLAEKLPFYQREMRIIEEQLHKICVDNCITDASFELPNLSYGKFLLSTVPSIEDIAKELHQELAPQFPYLAAFKRREKFDYDSLKFLDKALNLGSKQIKIESDLVILNTENRTLSPLLNAYNNNNNQKKQQQQQQQQQQQRPSWLDVYQNSKHEYSSAFQTTIQSVANDKNSTTTAINNKSIPTAKTVLEAAGAYFLLFSVAKSLPLNKHVPYGDFDPKFGSNIFTTTSTRPTFASFIGNLDNSSLKMDPKWQKSLFIVKDTDDYIITLRNQYDTMLNKAMQENPDFLAFYSKLPDNQKNNSFGYIIHKYGEATGDSEWNNSINSINIQIYNEYISNWKNQNIAFMRANKTEPIVVLNTYKDDEPIYDYAKINNS